MPGAREVLTEIFKSCAHSEQMLSLTPAKPIKVSDIYLSKEQINSQTPGNLLHLFFTNVRPPKKVLEDQLTQVATLSPPLLCWASGMPWAQPEALSLWSPQILRKYGVPKPKFDKSKYSKAGKEQHPGKVVSTKRPITKPPTKDKAVLNSVRWAAKEHRSQTGGRTRATCQQASWEAVGTSGKPDSLTLLYCWGPFCPHLHQLEENVSFDAQG